MLKNPYAKNAKLTCRFLVQGLRITAEKGFYCFNLPYQMSDGPKAITRICLKVQLQVVIIILVFISYMYTIQRNSPISKWYQPEPQIFSKSL